MVVRCSALKQDRKGAAQPYLSTILPRGRPLRCVRCLATQTYTLYAMNRPAALDLQHFWMPPRKKGPRRPKPSGKMPIIASFSPDVERRQRTSFSNLNSQSAATLTRFSFDEELNVELRPNHADVANRDTEWTPSLREAEATVCGTTVDIVRRPSQGKDLPGSRHSTPTSNGASLHGVDTISQNTKSHGVGHGLSPTRSIYDYPIDPLLDNRQNADMDGVATADECDGSSSEQEEMQRRSCVLLSSSPTAISCDELHGQQTATLTPPPDSISETDCPVFDEWPLQDALLKRVIIDGVAVVQLQFEWPLCATHAESSGMRRKFSATRSRIERRQTSGVPSRRSRFTPQEDTLLRRLKETSNSWREIHRQFSAQFPGRTTGALQVHYCTKLKGI